MDFQFEITTAVVLMTIFMAALWLFHIKKGEADIVDAGWAAGLGFIAIFYSLTSEGDWLRRCLLAIIASMWATRLSSYILFKRVLISGEDGRYKKLREKWGKSANFKFFWFFQAQGLLVVILSMPFFIVAANKAPFLKISDYLGIGVFLFSILGESLADLQLSRFRNDPANKGRTCRTGLWYYSRHPNYFFEWLHWWSYVFLAVGSSYFLFSLIGPVIIYYLIVNVTGIPPTENQALTSRGDDYREYQRTTNAFFPWFPRQ